jgi:hypothetical protein
MAASEEQFWGAIPASDDLTCHFVSGITEFTSETKICQFELAIRTDEQIIRLEILKEC